MTVGELSAIGRAAILVPFAAATNNHQELNARVVERAGGAVVITEAELSPEQLAAAITDIVSDPRTRGAHGRGGEDAGHAGSYQNHRRFDRNDSEKLIASVHP